MNSKLWKLLAGLVSLGNVCSVDGDGGTGAGGAAPGSSDGGAGGGGAGGGGAAPGNTGGAAPPAVVAPPAAAPASKEASLATQEATYDLKGVDGKPERALGESSDAFLGRFREWRKDHPLEDTITDQKTPEQIAAEKKTKDDAAAAAAAAGETPEQKAAREKAAKDALAQETPEQKAAREKAIRDAAEAMDFDDLSPVPTEKLAEVFKKNPALQAEMEKALAAEGLSTDALFAAARLAHKGSGFMKEFATLETAQHAKAKAGAFQQMEERFTDIQPGHLESTASFVNQVMMPLSFLRDPDTGEVLMDKESGLPLHDGTVFNFLDNVVNLRTDYLSKEVERLTAKSGPEAALQFLAGRDEFARLLDVVIANADKVKDKDRGEQAKLAATVLKEWGKGGTSSAAEGELPEAVKRELEQARVDRQNAAKQTLDATKQRIENFQTEVLSESSKETDSSIAAYLVGTSLEKDALRPQIEKEIRDALYENLSNDPLYTGQRDDITRKGLNKTTHAAWVALNKRETAARLKDIAGPIFAKYGGRRVARGKERQATADAQAKLTQQHEVQGGAGGAHLPGQVAPKGSKELIAQARENLTKRSETVDQESLMKEFRRLQAEQKSLVA